MTKKDQAMRAAILQRTAAIDKLLELNPNLPPTERAFYLGKKEGLMQGYDLAGSTLKCISVELR